MIDVGAVLFRFVSFLFAPIPRGSLPILSLPTDTSMKFVGFVMCSDFKTVKKYSFRDNSIKEITINVTMPTWLNDYIRKSMKISASSIKREENEKEKGERQPYVKNEKIVSYIAKMNGREDGDSPKILDVVRSQGREESIFGLWVNDYVCGMNKSRVAAATFAHTTLSSGKRRALVVTLPEEFHAGSTCTRGIIIVFVQPIKNSPDRKIRPFLLASYINHTCALGAFTALPFVLTFTDQGEPVDPSANDPSHCLDPSSILSSSSLESVVSAQFVLRGDGVNFQRRQFDLEIYLRGFRF